MRMKLVSNRFASSTFIFVFVMVMMFVLMVLWKRSDHVHTYSDTCSLPPSMKSCTLTVAGGTNHAIDNAYNAFKMIHWINRIDAYLQLVSDVLSVSLCLSCDWGSLLEYLPSPLPLLNILHVTSFLINHSTKIGLCCDFSPCFECFRVKHSHNLISWK